MSERRPDAMAPKRRRPALAVLARAGGAVVLVGTFTGALALAVSLHAEAPAFRRAAAAIGNRAMAGLFEGTIVVTGVESLSLGPRSTVRVKHVAISDPEGQRVLSADDVEAAIDLRRLLASLTSGGRPEVAVSGVRVGSADVVLDLDARGAPRIARAFQSRGAHAAESPAKTPPSRQPYVEITPIVVAHAHVHGDLASPTLDGDLDGALARVTFDHGVVRVGLDETRATLRSPAVPRQRAPLTGVAKAALTLDTIAEAMSGDAELVGSCGAVPVTARARIDRDEIEAFVDVANTEPDAIVATFGDLPLAAPVELHAHAHGKLPTLALDARGRLGAADMSARGEIDLREGRAFTLDVEAAHVDARAFGAEVATDLSAKIHGEGVLGEGALLGSFRITTTEGRVADERVPAAFIEGRIEGERVTATLRASEPGVAVTGKVTLDLPSKVASFDLQAQSSELRSLSRAPKVVGGAASARVRGEIDLERRTIHANTTASGERIAFDGFSARHVGASGVIEGPLAAPVLDVGVAGVDVRTKAHGEEPLVYPAASGRAKVAFVPTPRILNASFKVGVPGSTDAVNVSTDAVHFTNGAIEARAMRVTGLGEPLDLDVQLGKAQWSVRAKSASVDVHRAAAMTGIEALEHLPAGTRASIDVDLRRGQRGPDGHVDLVVRTERGAIGAGEIVAEVHASITRGKLVGGGKIASEGFGAIEISRAELDLPNDADARSLQSTTGTLELRGAIDLSQGAALLARPPLHRASGVASFEAQIERGDPDALPAVRATVKTKGLEVAIAGERASRTFEIAGVDLLAHVAWDGRTEVAEVALLSWDEHGLVASTSAKAKLPLVRWATGASPLDADAIAKLEVDVVADAPSRDVATLPPMIRAPELRGKLGAQLRLTGPVGRPNVVLSAQARGLRFERQGIRRASSDTLDPLDGALEARWDGERAAVTFALDERRRLRFRRDELRPAPETANASRTRKEPGHLRGLVLLGDVRMSDLLRGRAPSELPWSASAEVELENLTLGALPLPNRIRGVLSGRASVRNLNRDASFEAKAHIDGFGTGGATVQSVDVNVGGRDASLFAHASVLDAQAKASFQLASRSLRISGVDVSWDATAPTRIDYAVQNGRLALIGPLVRRSISEIDGRVDGAGSVTLDAATQVFDGGLSVQGAKLYVNALGEEISSLDAALRFDRSGTFRVDGATGKMGSGAFRGSASGRMKGLEFVGAEATIVVPKDAVPLSAEAVMFAEATGEVKIVAKMSDDREALLLNVDVPRATIQIPDRSTQSLQSLDPDPTVAVGVRDARGELDTRVVRRARGGTRNATRSDALATRMDVTIGDGVHLEGRGLDVSIRGRALVEIANELSITGRIDLRGGTIEVHGRRFQVDHGIVTFPESDEPDNPTIVAAAYWDAPDRTRVWVELAGPLKTGTLTLRSEPAYSKTEILSVLLFGRPDPNMATDGGATGKKGDTAGATAVGTGFVASDINRMLAEIDPNLDVETDTMSGNRTRGKVGHSFFDRRVKVQIGYAAGTTQRERDTTFLFLNWQFIPKWTFVATAGDKGTSILDVLFQHRY